MSYPAEWRPFLQQFLRHEGGYVRTGTMETLFGLIDRTWVEHLPNVPQSEINAQPEPSRSMLNGIRSAPAGQRIGLVREWMRTVGRETHAMDGRPQPESGIPRQSKEWTEAGGNRALVAATQELSSGIIYRGYIVDAGFGALNVNRDTLASIVDAGARHGVYFTWAMLAKAGETSGLYDQATTNRLGWLDSAQLPVSASYREGQGGYNYTRRAGQRETIAAINAGLTPERQSAFQDEVGYWRRVFVTNPRDGEEIKQWDLQRIADFHGSPSEYALRQRERTPTQPANASGETHGEHVALVQMRDGWFSAPEVAIQLPGLAAPLVYNLQTVDTPEGERVQAVGNIVSLPVGAEILGPDQVSRLNGKSHNYPNTQVVVWRTPDGRVMDIALPPRLNALAVEQNPNTTAFGLMTASSFTQNTEGSLDPSASARLEFTDASQSMMYTPPPATPSAGPIPQAQAATRTPR